MTRAHTFDAATAVTPDGPDRWRGEITPGWDIAGNTNGGALLSVAVRAMLAATQRPDPVTVTGHFLAPGREGPVIVDVDVIRRGRRFATASAELRSADGGSLVAALGTFGDLRHRPEVAAGTERVNARPPDLPPPEDCVPTDAETAFPFNERVDLRLHPDDAGFRTGNPSGRARVTGWFRLPGGEPVTTTALVLATDSFPPTIFNADVPIGWAPTVELTAHVRAQPEPGWLRCAFSTRFVTGGFLEEDGEIWDRSGRLVAQSRQLALLPRPV